MNLISEQLINVLNYLLPGFISAWIYYALTAHPKPSEFERIIQAFIFTVFIQIFVKIFYWLSIIIGDHLFILGKWTNNTSFIISVIIAVLFGLIFVKYANNDKIHAVLRDKKINITKETSYPSEWYGELSKKQTYLVLHFKDGRRIYGWPEEWPSDPSKGHFSLAEAEWLTEKNGENVRIALNNVDNILIPSIDVQFVEIMKLDKINEDDNG